MNFQISYNSIQSYLCATWKNKLLSMKKKKKNIPTSKGARNICLLIYYLPMLQYIFR